MTEEASADRFAQIVEWAYSTLPEEIRNLPDFPGIQVADEPPSDVLARIRKERNWSREKELLGLYSGLHRNQPQHFYSRMAPDLIFVFRGPILRCSRGNLPAEVKQVVWHEVAHWLGHNEAEVKELGLSRAFDDIAHDPPETQTPAAVSREGLPDAIAPDAETSQHLRCIKCYSSDVTCREVDKPPSYLGANPFDPTVLHAKRCQCNSCGHEWDDEDGY
ncbi:MAG TPA: metallopeptidase family protein [Verrucomicrobiae bacterium]|nr:metallopeptidase family protein [Verrucomicrobiae bacterium]